MKLTPEEMITKLNNIQEIPTLPAIAMEINRLLTNEKTTIEILSKTIEKDQAITVKLLKLINSAFYGLRTSVNTVSEAVILLGFNTVRNIVVSISVIKNFSEKKHGHLFNMPGFWHHSIATAIISKYLAKGVLPDKDDDCFVGGLLHDVGKIIILEFFPEIFKEILLEALDHDDSFHTCEKKLIPIDHSMIGTLLVKKWKLPVTLAEIIKNHQKYSNDNPFREHCAAVYLANNIAHMNLPDELGIIRKEYSKRNSLLPKDLQHLFLKKINSSEEWFPELNENIKEGCSFFLGTADD